MMLFSFVLALGAEQGDGDDALESRAVVDTDMDVALALVERAAWHVDEQRDLERLVRLDLPHRLRAKRRVGRAGERQLIAVRLVGAVLELDASLRRDLAVGELDELLSVDALDPHLG